VEATLIPMRFDSVEAMVSIAKSGEQQSSAGPMPAQPIGDAIAGLEGDGSISSSLPPRSVGTERKAR